MIPLCSSEYLLKRNDDFQALAPGVVARINSDKDTGIDQGKAVAAFRVNIR